MSTNVNDYNFNLPDELIAQSPLLDRSSSKLLVLNPVTKDIEHKTFSDITSMLSKDDVLVLNDTRVIPARIIGVKESTGANIEILLLNEINKNQWKCLIKPAKRIKVGDKIIFGEGLLVALCVECLDEGIRVVEFSYQGIFLEVLDQLGSMPLPPYILEKLEDNERYQTVYSKDPGSVAAPTAGLHFTEEILKNLKNKGVTVTYVTLHVGLGTFRPVSVDNVLDHKMHEEKYSLNEENAKILQDAKKNGKRIIAVGTTSIRTLETIYKLHNDFIACSGETDIFIYPGFEFKAVDALITNFHLPKSTLMMLISALVDRETMLNTYQVAINEKYRFFSFGDSMFIDKKKKEN